MEASPGGDVGNWTNWTILCSIIRDDVILVCTTCLYLLMLELCKISLMIVLVSYMHVLGIVHQPNLCCTYVTQKLCVINISNCGNLCSSQLPCNFYLLTFFLHRSSFAPWLLLHRSSFALCTPSCRELVISYTSTTRHPCSWQIIPRMHSIMRIRAINSRKHIHGAR